jgi:hypothetical protein
MHGDDDIYLYVRKDYQDFPHCYHVFDRVGGIVYACHTFNTHGMPPKEAEFFPSHISIKAKDFSQFTDQFGKPFEDSRIIGYASHLPDYQREYVLTQFHEYKKDPTKAIWAIPEALLSKTWARRYTGLFVPVENNARVGEPYKWLTREEAEKEAAARRAAAIASQQKASQLFARFNGGPGIAKTPDEIPQCMRPATANERDGKDAFLSVDSIQHRRCQP